MYEERYMGEINCKDCIYAKKKVIRHHDNYVNTHECELGYEIMLGGTPGCDGNEFEQK